MNCTNCDYPLWNIKDRRCPECGQEFAPSAFKFVPRSVRFCCPHCQQHYFGTGVDGHLVPRTFDCVSCGNRIDMDEMVLLPAEGLEDAQTRTGMNPWIDPRRSGFFGKWLATIGRGMFNPGVLIDQTPSTSSVGRAIAFSLVTSLSGVLVSGGAFLLFMGVMSVIAAPGPGAGGFAAIGSAIVAMVLFGVAISAVWLLIWILLTHFILSISGSTAGGLRRTTQCMCYASAPAILYAVPCISMYLSPIVIIWQVVCGTVMLSKSQKISGLRATIAILTPPLLLAAAAAALFIWFMTIAIGAAATFAQGGAGTTTIQGIHAQTLSLSLHTHAISGGGYPAHAVELLRTGQASPGDFVMSTNPLDGDAVPVGPTTLGKIELMRDALKTQTIDAIVQAQPASVLAHRVGDVVFTYHGLDPMQSDRGLWVFITEPPPPSQSPPQPQNAPAPWMPPMQATDTFFVGTVGGGTTAIPRANFAGALAAQNSLRSGFGLPPLPDPATVTANAPALGPK